MTMQDRFKAQETRYVITHISNGQRRLTFAMQGRETYATAREAQDYLDCLLRVNDLRKVMAQDEINTLAVKPCACWPGHYDPKSMWFGSTLGWLEANLTTCAGLPGR